MTGGGEKARGGGGFLGKTAGVVTGGGVYVVFFGMVLAWGSALVHWVGTVGTWTGWEWAGVAAGLSWAGVCVWELGVCGRRWGDRTFVVVASGVALLAGLSWAWTTRGMGRWPMDSGLYRWFLERLAEGGYAVENLRRLTWVYDYTIWTKRALPFLYPLRLWAGSEGFGFAVQIFQAVLGAAGVALAWWVTKLCAGGKAARWCAIGLVSMPDWALRAVGLNHQVLGSCAFLAAWALLAEWLGGGGERAKKIWLAVASCVVVPVLRLAGFAGTMYLFCAGALLGVEIVCRGEERRCAGWALLWLVAIPWVVALLVTHPVDCRVDGEANPVPIRGGQLAFAARGWDLAYAGEYVETGEQLDILTPGPQKNRFFLKYLASQCAYNGGAVVGRLFPAKLAKFMLLGYASLGEEVLFANGADAVARAARGARVAWFLVFGVLGVVGLKMMDRRVLEVDGGRKVAWLVVPVAMFAVAVVLAGETSPRYSMPVQPLLFAVAAWGLCEEGPRRKWGMIDKNAGFSGFIAAVAGVALVAAVVAGCGGVWSRWALLDMREASLEGGAAVADATQAPYEARFPGGGGSVTWRGEGGAVAAYAWGAGWRDRGEIEVRTCEDGEWQRMRLPMRIVAHWRDGERRRLEVRRCDGKGPLSVGYASEAGAGACGSGGGGE